MLLQKMRRAPFSGGILGACLVTTLMLFSCSIPEDFQTASDRSQTSGHIDYTSSGKYGKVMILYSAGFNSLVDYLNDDIEELTKGYVPKSSHDVILVFSRKTPSYLKYTTETPAVLFRIKKTPEGETVCDTLKTFPADQKAATAATMREVLTFVNENYPADSYGMIFSSHASGWLPKGYYNNPSRFEAGAVTYSGSRYYSRPRPVPYVPLPEEPGLPAVKSVGQDVAVEGTATVSYEMNLKEFAGAIPMHMDYILFDACLMGCVEVAYELRNVTDYVAFSPTEVLAEGFNYTTLASRLLEGDAPDPKAVCVDYFSQYENDTTGGATITLVDTRKMNSLVSVCKTLFEKYRTAILNLNPGSVQGYYRNSRYYFFDLEDILIRAGITETEKSTLEDALSECIVYKNSTAVFLTITIRTYSGFSMFLPSIMTKITSKDFTYLKNFYLAEVGWNEATELVR